MCATTPAEQVGRPDWDELTVGATADLTVLDAQPARPDDHPGWPPVAEPARRHRPSRFRGECCRCRSIAGSESRRVSSCVPLPCLWRHARSISTLKASCPARRSPSRSPESRTSSSRRSTAPSKCIRGTATKSRSRSSGARWSRRSSIKSRSSAEQQGDRIVIKVTGPSDREFDGIQIGMHFSPTARLRVARAASEPAVGQERRRLGHGRGRQRQDRASRTNDGSVRGNRLAGDITVRSGDGSIRMDRIEGKLDLETEDGSIGLEAKPSALRARTADGSIRLEIAAGRGDDRGLGYPDRRRVGDA